jgi:hypothetical protein
MTLGAQVDSLFCRTAITILRVWRFRFRRVDRTTRTQEQTACGQFLFSYGVAQEAIMTNPDEARGQNVKQEPANELVRLEGQSSDLV